MEIEDYFFEEVPIIFEDIVEPTDDNNGSDIVNDNEFEDFGQ